uniref:DDE Tnp4 domain-containing protein n=1 Tax=Steinernema glaseri TaxID=37863 RepID=A0A1I8AK40_9BILA
MGSCDPSLAHFCAITRAEQPFAAIYLKENNGDLNKALRDFYAMERATYVSTAALKEAQFHFVPPVTPRFSTPYVDIPEALLKELHSSIGKMLKSSLPKPFDSFLTPRVRILIYYSAVTKETSLFRIARKFGISYQFVLPIVMEVANAINQVYSFAPLTKEDLRGNADRFMKRTGFPHVAATLARIQWDFVVVLNAEQRIIWCIKKTLENTINDLRPLLPDSAKFEDTPLSFRFITTEPMYPRCEVYTTYFAYPLYGRGTLSVRERAYNAVLQRVMTSEYKTIRDLQAIFHLDFRKFNNNIREKLLLSCVHLFNIIRSAAKCKPVFALKDCERNIVADFLLMKNSK